MSDSPLSVAPQELLRVPMFPLPNTVLLPGSLLPLHMFEPRYRDLTRDVLAGSGLLVMARLQDGEERDDAGRLAVHTTVGVGRIIDSHELPDGRYDILVRGLIRATLAEELASEEQYRQVRTVHLHDIDGAEHPAVLRATHAKLLTLCDELADVIDKGGPQLRALVRSVDEPGACADTVSAVLVSDPDERQRLLETRDPAVRLERSIRHVSHILADLGADDTPGSLN